MLKDVIDEDPEAFVTIDRTVSQSKVYNMDLILECWKQHLQCKNLLEVEAKKDPETEPFRSKYEARRILLKSKDLLKKELEGLSTNDSTYDLVKAAFSTVIGQIGIICLETNEYSVAEDYFMECLSFISDPLHPDCILVSVQVRNQLGFLWSHRSQPNEAQKWLEEAEKLYKDFRSNPDKRVKLFGDYLENSNDEDGEKELEIAHTLTKFYLAQVYGALKDLLKSAIYCHETLRRELEFKQYDPIDWALNSATLSQFFMERLLFKQARHHLAAASYVLDTYEETLKEAPCSQEELDAKKEELLHRSSDVSRCWAKYGIFLLEHSKTRLTSGEEEKVEEKNEGLEQLWFESLDLTHYENQIADSDLVAFEDAREVFLITQKHLNKAKEYYSLEDRASDHVQIVQDHSQLFRHLAAFEPDEERQFKMMKKRVDMLEVVLKELNPKYYIDVCRQLWFELGETYHDMMQVKFQKVKDSGEMPAPQALKKINVLAETSIVNFNNFLDSIKDKKSGEIPNPIPEELIGPTLVAHFYLGRLYYKYITQDRRKQIENTTKAYECFKYLVENCESSEKAKNVVGEELNISKEMMTLLQMKILQL